MPYRYPPLFESSLYATSICRRLTIVPIFTKEIRRGFSLAREKAKSANSAQ